MTYLVALAGFVNTGVARWTLARVSCELGVVCWMGVGFADACCMLDAGACGLVGFANVCCEWQVVS